MRGAELFDNLCVDAKNIHGRKSLTYIFAVRYQACQEEFSRFFETGIPAVN